MADYVQLALTVFAINVIPAFMPPTWVVLALAKVNDPSFDPLTLTLVGAFSSTLGRGALTLLSTFFRRFFSKELALHADKIREFFAKKGAQLFAGTFAYSLSPFPSNLIFIANGLTEVDWKPVFSGFFLGRLVSYFALIFFAGHIFGLLNSYFNNGQYVTYLFDALGILAAFSVLFVHWEKYLGKNWKETAVRK
jgi:uncharacterized membrane protein YdjX (TVP38/TMEM64 family)